VVAVTCCIHDKGIRAESKACLARGRAWREKALHFTYAGRGCISIPLNDLCMALSVTASSSTLEPLHIRSSSTVYTFPLS
jgi:hypothetical protein